MTSDFTILTSLTVTSNYSWDDGVPALSSSSAVMTSATEISGVYYGVAPYFYVELSSVSNYGTVDPDKDVLWLEWNFDDYYNMSSNTITVPLSSFVPSHVYIMPGTYSVSLRLIKETTIAGLTLVGCENVHSVQWNWSNTGVLGAQPIEYDESAALGDFPKRWYNEFECQQKYCVAWTWYLLQSTTESPGASAFNTPVTWENTTAGRQYEKTWLFEPSEVVCLNDSTYVPLNSSVTVVEQKLGLFRIEENPPIAFLSAIPTSSPLSASPLEVTLTPRFSRCGSFPIERIIWNFDDGKAPVVVERNGGDPSLFDSRFVYTGLLSADPADPRNYDAEVVYKRTKTSNSTFYPAITAVSSSTGTKDCATAFVGPIYYTTTPSNSSVELVDIEITNQGEVVFELYADDHIILTK